MLEFTLGFGRVLDFGGTGTWCPPSPAAHLSACAWHINDGVWYVHGGDLCWRLGGASGSRVLGRIRGLSDGVLVYFERVNVV